MRPANVEASLESEFAAQFDAAVDACEASLAKLHGCIVKKQWGRPHQNTHQNTHQNNFTAAEQAYARHARQLQELCESHGEEMSHLDGAAGRLRALSQRQRRVMRLLASHMRALSADVAVLEHDARRLKLLRADATAESAA